jgi:hypothetical protein
LAAVLAEVNALGPFFAVATHPAEASPTGPWLRLTELLAGPRLGERIAATRVALATSAGCAPEEVELRVAASVTQLGLAARLLSPALAVGVLNGGSLDLDPSRVWWQPVLGGPLPLSIPLGTGETNVVSGPIAALTLATQRACPVSSTVLWGNVASAVNGATTMIRTQRPDLAARAAAYANALLARSDLNAENVQVGPGFRRRSCCLIYRLAPGPAQAICGDCVLHA